MYQRKVDVDMLNAVQSVLADVSSVIPASALKLLLRPAVCMYAFDCPVARQNCHFQLLRMIVKLVGETLKLPECVYLCTKRKVDCLFKTSCSLFELFTNDRFQDNWTTCFCVHAIIY